MINKNLSKIKKHILGAVLCSFSFSFFPISEAIASDLQSGPMLGYSEMKEVLLWVQTKKPAKVKFVYHEKSNPKVKFTTEEVLTSKDKAYTAKILADQVLPGKKYVYELFIDSKKVEVSYPLEFQSQKLWQHRTDPPDFSVATGSCAYINDPEYDRPGKPYGDKDGKIFTSIYEKHPDLMIWLGDNTYLREADWNSKTGIFYRYTHTRSLPEMQPLLGSVHNYAIWDDHDFGPNDSDRNYRNKEDTLEAFKLFWGNPSFGQKNNEATYTKFEWGDAEFFLLDGRYFKSPNDRKDTEATVLGKEQLDWLLDSLSNSKANFKVIALGIQFLNPVDFDYLETYSRLPEEKSKILKAIEKEKISGVLFLTGDRHHTELSVLKRENSYPIYDLTVSPLTSQYYDATKEPNTLRLPETLVGNYNFSILSFSGPKKDRTMKMSVYDKFGKELWNKSIKASELK